MLPVAAVLCCNKGLGKQWCHLTVFNDYTMLPVDGVQRISSTVKDLGGHLRLVIIDGAYIRNIEREKPGKAAAKQEGYHGADTE